MCVHLCMHACVCAHIWAAMAQYPVLLLFPTSVFQHIFKWPASSRAPPVSAPTRSHTESSYLGAHDVNSDPRVLHGASNMLVTGPFPQHKGTRLPHGRRRRDGWVDGWKQTLPSQLMAQITAVSRINGLKCMFKHHHSWLLKDKKLFLRLNFIL